MWKEVQWMCSWTKTIWRNETEKTAKALKNLISYDFVACKGKSNISDSCHDTGEKQYFIIYIWCGKLELSLISQWAEVQLFDTKPIPKNMMHIKCQTK